MKTKLVADKVANLTRVDVDTNNGTVYLNGAVETPEQKVRPSNSPGKLAASRPW